MCTEIRIEYADRQSGLLRRLATLYLSRVGFTEVAFKFKESYLLFVLEIFECYVKSVKKRE